MANVVPHSASAVSVLEKKVAKALAGIARHFGDATPYRIAGRPWSKAQMMAFLAPYSGAAEAVRDAVRQYHLALKARRQLEDPIRAFLSHLEDTARAAMHGTGVSLTEFGLPDRRKGKMTVHQKQARAEKAWATRVANRTLGKRQKKALREGVPLEKVLGWRRPKK